MRYQLCFPGSSDRGVLDNLISTFFMILLLFMQMHLRRFGGQSLFTKLLSWVGEGVGACLDKTHSKQCNGVHDEPSLNVWVAMKRDKARSTSKQ